MNNFIKCQKCKRRIHDYSIPDKIWDQVAKPTDVYCYDCFCMLASEKNIFFRLTLDCRITKDVSRKGYVYKKYLKFEEALIGK